MPALFHLSRLLGGPTALAALLLGPAPATQAQATFAAAVSYPVGGEAPVGVVVADVNRDGRPDVVVANQAGGTVSVLLGQASPAGTLGIARPYSTGASNGGRPTGVAVGDLNGDGLPDIAAVNQTYASVAVLLNSAAAPGTFRAATEYVTGGSSPNLLQLADLDGDGRLDMVVGNSGGGTVVVLYASATVAGTFDVVADYAVAGSPLGVAVADVNRDGRPDVVVAAYGSTGTVSVLLNSATAPGRLGSPTTYPSGGITPVDVALSDLNADGYLDLVVSHNGSYSVSVLAGTAAGTFGPAVSYPVLGEPNLLALADVTNDGRPDVVVGSRTTNAVSVLAGRATPAGTFEAAVSYPVGAGTRPAAVAVGDLDNDGRPDLVLANNGNSTVSVLLNTTSPTTGPTGPANEASLYPNPARGTFTVQLPASPTPAAVQAELLDALGRVVRRAALYPTPDARLTVDAAGLAAGRYLLRLQAATWQLTRAVVLE